MVRVAALLALAVFSAVSLPAQGRSSRAASQPEWLSTCAQCPNPTVTSKSGTGTARAVAEARMTSAELRNWCSESDPQHIENCVRKALAEERGRIYHATADCTAGRITTTDEKAYSLAGLWDNSDIGGGRTKWRGADGEIVGRDNASNGLAIAQQWEVLCPGPVRPGLLASLAAHGRSAITRSSESAEQPSGRSGAPAAACAGKRYCDEVDAFAAIIRDLRPSIYNESTRAVSATVRFLNKTRRPLLLGYVRSAGVAIDEQGNRYILPSAASVHGIGEIAGREFDPKFAVLPGQTADARFEFVWRWNGRDIIGQRAWDIDLTVREVRDVAPSQYQFGQEHALQFKTVLAANAPDSVQTSRDLPAAAKAAPASAPISAASEPDACAGRPRCYDAGPFAAEIAQAVLTREGNFQDRVVRMNIRFRNKGADPITLAYVTGTSTLVDNRGNRFSWGSGHDISATGIGKVESNRADPQFVLRPGESRGATFTVFRRRPPRTDPDGATYTYSVTIAQLEVLSNGQQVRTVREHSLMFPDFGLNGTSGPATAPGGSAKPQTLEDLNKTLRGAFGRKKR